MFGKYIHAQKHIKRGGQLKKKIWSSWSARVFFIEIIKKKEIEA